MEIIRQNFDDKWFKGCFPKFFVDMVVWNGYNIGIILLSKKHRSCIHMNEPAKIIENTINTGIKKASLSPGRMVLLGIAAGIFIALGACTSSTAAHSIQNVGVARLVTGCVFPVGLMMVVLTGSELFTGNSLMIVSVLERKIRLAQMLRNLVIVYAANLIGSLFIAILIYFSGNLDYSDHLLGAYTIKVAVGKAGITPLQGITSGILCNILVCLAILLAGAAKNAAGKIWGIFFPIFAFVVGGFEHIVANMYYIPAGMIAAINPDYVKKAADTYHITESGLSRLSVSGLLSNFGSVTIGNIIGGMAFTGILFWMVHHSRGQSVR